MNCMGNSFQSSYDYYDHPVRMVGWNEAIEFCKRLSKHARREYTLPSESQWEYACRAGTTTSFYFGETITTDVASYNQKFTEGEEYRKPTTAVGSFPPNAFGLYDMHGNVSEWCLDTWHENYHGAPTDGSAWIDLNNDKHVARGGNCFSDKFLCRSASRSDCSADGFRVVSPLSPRERLNLPMNLR
jgi:formylglycine-generating enzyme required for sulfatase activity